MSGCAESLEPPPPLVASTTAITINAAPTAATMSASAPPRSRRRRGASGGAAIGLEASKRYRRSMRVVSAPTSIALDDDLLIEGDNADVLPLLPDGAFDLVYIDPPFNTGRRAAAHALGLGS